MRSTFDSKGKIVDGDAKLTAEQKIKSTKLTPTKIYLILYNLASSAAWGAILLLLLSHIISPSSSPETVSSPTTLAANKILSYFNALKAAASSSPTQNNGLPTTLIGKAAHRLSGAYVAVGPLVTVVQSFAVLEVAHAVLGLVRSPVATTAAQVASRLWTVWAIVEQSTAAQSSPIYSVMILAWSATEVIRYLFYALNLVGMNPRSLLWLRYSTFYPFYPMGALSEAWLAYVSMPPFANLPFVGHLFGTPITSFMRGDVTGSSWQPLDFAKLALIGLWPPALAVMMLYMSSQRRKALRTGPKVSGGKKRA